MAVPKLVPQNEFDPESYSKLRIGMEVEASTDPHGTNPGVGHICGIEGQSVHIFFAAADSNLGARVGVLEDCWLIDDPRVKRQPQLVCDQERRAVFWLSENQKKFESYSEHINALTEALEAIVAREKTLTAAVDRLEDRLKSLDGRAASLRGK